MFNVNLFFRYFGNVNIVSKKIDFFVYKREKLVLLFLNLYGLNLYNYWLYLLNFIRIFFMGCFCLFLILLGMDLKLDVININSVLDLDEKFFIKFL